MLPLALLRAPAFLPDSLAAAFFENHWVWWLCAAALAIVMLYLSRTRTDRRLGTTGLVIFGATLLWALFATLIQTRAERLYAAHAALSAAVKNADVDTIVSYLASDFTAPQLGITAQSLPKDQIAAILKDNGVKDTLIRDYHAVQTGSSALTSITVLTKINEGPFLSTWQLSWDDLPNDDWKIRNARLLTLNNQPISDKTLLTP